MNQKAALAIALALVVVLCFGVRGALCQQQGGPGRTIGYAKGRPIASQLKAGEKEVVLDLRSTPPLQVVPPAGKSAAEFRTEASDVVLLVRSIGVRPFVTPEGDFIKSAVTFNVLDVVKASPKRQFVPSDSFEWQAPGGTADVQGTKVHAVIRWARELGKDKTYLVFATVNDATGELAFNFGDLFEVTPGGLRSGAWNAVEKSISDEPVEVVTARIRDHVKKMKK